MLLAVGSKIELAHGELVFVYAELFQVFAEGKVTMKQAIPRLGMEDSGFAELKEPVLSQALLIWSRPRGLNS